MEKEKKKYEKPKIEEVEKMDFMFMPMQKKELPQKIACRQCSSCHACR